MMSLTASIANRNQRYQEWKCVMSSVDVYLLHIPTNLFPLSCAT